MYSFNLCQHTRTNGMQCQSPALGDARYCHFHGQMHDLRCRRHKNRSKAAFELPLLEDAGAVQIAIMQVCSAVLENRIDQRTAGLLLYALQTASANLKRVNFEPVSLRTATQTRLFLAQQAEAKARAAAEAERLRRAAARLQSRKSRQNHHPQPPQTQGAVSAPAPEAPRSRPGSEAVPKKAPQPALELISGTPVQQVAEPRSAPASTPLQEPACAQPNAKAVSASPQAPVLQSKELAPPAPTLAAAKPAAPPIVRDLVALLKAKKIMLKDLVAADLELARKIARSHTGDLDFERELLSLIATLAG